MTDLPAGMTGQAEGWKTRRRQSRREPDLGLSCFRYRNGEILPTGVTARFAPAAAVPILQESAKWR
jgi:hypothetical protein